MPRKFFTSNTIPDNKNAIVKLLNQLENSRCQAWTLVYGLKTEIENEHTRLNQIKIEMENEHQQIGHVIPQHIKNEFKELYSQLHSLVECSICLSDIDPESLTLTHCGHKFHKDCIRQQIVANGNKCPVCRKINTIQI
jgi:hypothetical protein